MFEVSFIGRVLIVRLWELEPWNNNFVSGEDTSDWHHVPVHCQIEVTAFQVFTLHTDGDEVNCQMKHHLTGCFDNAFK